APALAPRAAATPGAAGGAAITAVRAWGCGTPAAVANERHEGRNLGEAATCPPVLCLEGGFGERGRLPRTAFRCFLPRSANLNLRSATLPEAPPRRQPVAIPSPAV